MKLKFINYDDYFDENNVITNKDGVDKKMKFTDDGVFSERIFGKLDNEGIQYTCDCGKYKGKFYNNKLCEVCNTNVKYIEPLVKRTGWITFDGLNIVNPNFFFMISRIIPKATLINIISFNKKIDKDGQLKEEEDLDVNPFSNLGLLEFYERFDEILDFYYSVSKAKNKEGFYNLIKSNREFVFIDKMPVFSPVLRPAMMMPNNNLIFDEINNFYNSIILNSNIIKSSTEGERTDVVINPLLADIQFFANDIYEKIIENMKGKTGFIRNNIMGSRVNFSARNVITPLPYGYEIDDIVVPYLTFIELYKFEIISILVSLKKINYLEANNIWGNATTHFNEEIYHIMEEIRTKTNGGLKVLLNRNPSINYGSILLLKIAGIKKDYEDVTMSISNNILPALAGDYDGDTLNLVPIKDNSLKKTFSVFSPKYMLISSNDGKFNNDFNIDRDQMLGMFSLNN